MGHNRLIMPTDLSAIVLDDNDLGFFFSDEDSDLLLEGVGLLVVLPAPAECLEEPDLSVFGGGGGGGALPPPPLMEIVVTVTVDLEWRDSLQSSSILVSFTFTMKPSSLELLNLSLSVADFIAVSASVSPS